MKVQIFWPRSTWVITSLLVTVFICLYLLISRNSSLSKIDNAKKLSADLFNSTGSNETLSARLVQYSIQIGDTLPNCGMKNRCPGGSFPVHVYTGLNHNDHPRLCVNGKYYFGKDLNNAGRGMNIAVIEPVQFQVVNVKHFDTYESDSTEMEIFLEKNILLGDIVVFLTFDEASVKLGDNARRIIFQLGSGMIQSLNFRAAWYMISQKGLVGFSPYEKLAFKKGDKWADVLDKKLCVQKKIEGLMITPDPIPRINEPRITFCNKYHGFGSFCDVENQNEPIVPAMLTNRSLIGNALFSTPIIVISGPSHSSLSLTLETLIRQPGISPQSVVVCYHESQEEAGELASLFGFRSTAVKEMNYTGILARGFGVAKEQYPLRPYAIVLDDGLLLAPDFLFYMSQLIHLLDKDPSLLAISAWNPNGYEGLSSDPHLAYRVEDFPGMAMLLRVSTYETLLKPKLLECCSDKSWLGWFNGSVPGYEIIVPDVSRVLRRPLEGLMSRTSVESELFMRQRVTNLDVFAAINSPESLMQLQYEKKLEELLRSSSALVLTEGELINCVTGQDTDTLKVTRSDTGKNYKIYIADELQMKYTCKCFGLFSAEGHIPRGLHKGVLRFTKNKNNIFLVNSFSPYYKSVSGGLTTSGGQTTMMTT